MTGWLDVLISGIVLIGLVALGGACIILLVCMIQLAWKDYKKSKER